MARLWKLVADWCCPGRVWRELGNARRSRLGDAFLRRPFQ